MNNTLEIIIIILLLAIIAEVYILTKPKKRYSLNQVSMLVDTSVLMDGRVVDLARTGFLLGQVVVPKSVLAELQLLADGSDHAKRERARLGMDAVKKLQDILGSSFSLLQDGSRTASGVDDQLINLAKQTDSAILTLDYNLNKVAQVEGVAVLNINELAKSIRMVHLPGDTVSIELTQKGQGSDQAVGYLSDGTMVVVEQAKKFIGKTKEVEIIRSLQTDAGKMMFAKLINDQPVKKKPTAILKRTVNQRTDRAAKVAGPTGTKVNGGQSRIRSSAGAQPNDMRKANSRPGPATTKSKPHNQAARPRSSSQREDDIIKLVEKQRQ